MSRNGPLNASDLPEASSLTGRLEDLMPLPCTMVDRTKISKVIKASRKIAMRPQGWEEFAFEERLTRLHEDFERITAEESTLK